MDRCTDSNEVFMTFTLLVPLLLLAAAALVLIGSNRSRQARARMAAYPVGAACSGLSATLYQVTAQGPVSFRFYDLSSIGSFAIPIGFHVDRLSAVMMTLITGVSTIIYCYSTSYMYQDRHARRYLALICLTDFVLVCMVSSGNLMMLFLFWQILSYLLYVLAHNHTHPGTLAGAFKTFTLLRVADTAFLAGIALAYQLYGTLEFQELFVRAAETPMSFPLGFGMEVSGATAVTILLFHRRDGKVGTVPAPSLAAWIALRSDPRPRVPARGHHQRRRILD